MTSPPENPSDAERRYLAAADLAQAGRYPEAAVEFERTLAMNPELHTARLQWGLLLLTMAEPDQAMAAWAPLANLPDSSPIRLFHMGLVALIRDDFQDCISLLRAGIDQI